MAVRHELGKSGDLHQRGLLSDDEPVFAGNGLLACFLLWMFVPVASSKQLAVQ